MADERLIELALRYVDSRGGDFEPWTPAASGGAGSAAKPGAAAPGKRKGLSAVLSVFGGIRQFIDPDVTETVRGIVGRPGESFGEKLLRFLGESGMTREECCSLARVDGKLFQEMCGDPGCRPKKEAVLALALALGLDAKAAASLLDSAGHALSPDSRADLAVSYCIRSGIRDVRLVDGVLNGLGLPPL